MLDSFEAVSDSLIEADSTDMNSNQSHLYVNLLSPTSYQAYSNVILGLSRCRLHSLSTHITALAETSRQDPILVEAWTTALMEV